MSDISNWYQTVPRFTKLWLTATVAISLSVKISSSAQMFAYRTLTLIPELAIWKFQIWRFATALFYYPVTASTGMHFLMNCFFLYNYSSRLERDHFKVSPSDYFFMLIFNWLCCVIAGMVGDFRLLMDPMVISVVYVWCQLNKDTIVTFWFGMRFKAMYLPWVILLFNMILNDFALFPLIGIVIGHIYFFLKFKYPQELGGATYLETPSILKQYFPDVHGVHGFGIPPANARPQAQANAPAGGIFRRSAWGQGHRLGD